MERKLPSWDDLFMSMVYLVAAKSKDESTNVGSVLVGPDNEVRSVGYNSFVRGINDSVKERQERPEKYLWMEHSERNCLYNAALAGICTKGCRIYTNGIPCTDCARAIIQCGIKEVIIDKEWDDNNYDIWIEHAKRTVDMFEEAGVSMRTHEFDLMNLCKYRRGKKI